LDSYPTILHGTPTVAICLNNKDEQRTIGSNSVGKRSYQYRGWRAWKIVQYLLLLPLYSIGISLRPVFAGNLVLPPAANLRPDRSKPLIYRIVQTEASSPATGNLETENGSVELNADRQEFNNNTQIVTADGKVVVRFNKALLNADQLQINLKTKIATAQGNVSLIRGQQVLYGNQFEYNFGDDKGTIMEARGDIYQPTLVTDLNVVASPKSPTNAGEKRFSEPLLSDKLRHDQPVSNIKNTSTTGIAIGSDRNIEYQPILKPSGTINRLRFQADKVDFIGSSVTASKVRLTNDPFSPPELQLKADRLQFKTINSEEDEIIASNGRLTIENNFDIPLPKDRLVLNKLGKDPNPFNVKYDGEERGGIYVENSFYPVFDPRFQLTVTPQYFIQSAITGLKFFDASVFGVKANLAGTIAPETTIQASAALVTFDINNLSNNLRGKASINRNLNLFSYPHTLIGETVYRDKIFNGSLGYQDVQSSLGGVLTSPNIPVGNTGVNFDYQVGAHIINANTDRQTLLNPIRSNDLATLSRYQTAANFSKSFRLWEGKGLSPDKLETYNYSPVPVVPYLQLNTGIRSAVSGYSNGDTQSSIGYNVGIQGQFGNFSKTNFDYTGFNLNYFQQFRGNSSPFLFDRVVDNRLLSAGINQQISGPFRGGIQSTINLDTGQQISTDYYLEYSRRTYNFILRYNPALQVGSIGFRLNDFNWDGVAPQF
jgi:lipopolysaccharide export system protein LptA